MEIADKEKPLYWVASAERDHAKFPPEVQDVTGFALDIAQRGGRHTDAKPMKGQGGAGVLEIVDDYDGNTYRAVYTVKFPKAVYVLHAFQKKSKSGIATPKQDLDLIAWRLKLAEAHYRNLELH